jgi:hypothetical protein
VSFRPFNLTADSICRERVPAAFQMAALIGLGASTSDASHALLHGSKPVDGCGAIGLSKPLPNHNERLHGESPGATTHVVKCFLIIAALLAFASGICEVLA